MAPGTCAHFCQANEFGCEVLRAGAGINWVPLPIGGV